MSEHAPTSNESRLPDVQAQLADLTSRLAAERGELNDLECEVARKIVEGKTVVRRLNDDFERTVTRPQRWADAVARVGGSWTFVIAALLVIMGWMTVNIALGVHSFDSYPFILLNLVLSSVAALQAPIIMMSQNRHSARDRMQADQDFLVNLKAELEISGLQSKVDHLLHTRWESLLATQQLQLELLQRLADQVQDLHSSDRR
jgi:uncharacterized membrane protein